LAKNDEWYILKYKKIRCYHRFCDKARYGFGYDCKICFLNFIKKFNPKSYELTVIADNCDNKNIDFIKNFCNQFNCKCIITNDGNSLGVINTCKLAFKNEEDTINYFIESDYIHKKNSKEALFDIFNNFGFDNFVSLYDHPDKYHPYFFNTNINMFLRDHCEIEEFKTFKSEIYYLKSGWWRTSPATCFTFACDTKNLINNFHYFEESCSNKEKPDDYLLWKNILSNNKKLFTPIPSYAGHTIFLPTGVDWKTI